MEFLGNQWECLDFWDLEDSKCFKFQAENISFQDWQMIRSLRMKVESKSILTPASIFSSAPFCGEHIFWTRPAWRPLNTSWRMMAARSSF